MIENIVIVMSNETIEIVENTEMIELTIEDAEVIEIIEIIVNIEIKDIIVTVENNKIARNTEITVNDVDHQKGRRVRKNMPVHKKGYAEVSLQKVPIERYRNDRQSLSLIRSNFLPVKLGLPHCRPWKAVVILQLLPGVSLKSL